LKHTYDEDDHDDSELEIIDLDTEASFTVNHRIVNTDPTGTTGTSMSATTLHFPYAWLRWAMVVLTLIGSLALLFLLWPDIAPSLRAINSKPVQATPTPTYAYQDIFSIVLPANNVTYIFTRNDQTQIPVSALVAVNADNGKLVWRYRGNMAGIPLLQGGMLYIPTSTGIDALRAADQSLLWHRDVTKSIDGLVVENNVLYATSYQLDSLDAIRVSDGALLWHLTSNEFVLRADHGIVYTSSSTGSSAILNARKVGDGSLLWQHEVLNNDFQVVHNVVYAPQDTSLIALRANNGSTLWHRNGTGNILAANNNLIIASSLDGNSIVALRVSDGATLWRYNVQNIRQSLMSDGVFYLKTTNKDNLIALNASNGALLWQVRAPGILLSADNGILCFDAPLPFPQGYIYALRASNGTQLWRHMKIGDQPEPVQNGIVYVVSSIDGKLTALRASNGSMLWQYQMPATMAAH
jgi:outer membrane protein assembly factor BamB